MVRECPVRKFIRPRTDPGWLLFSLRNPGQQFLLALVGQCLRNALRFLSLWGVGTYCHDEETKAQDVEVTCLGPFFKIAESGFELRLSGSEACSFHSTVLCPPPKGAA